MPERLCLRPPFQWLLRLFVVAGTVLAQPALSQTAGLRLSLELGPQHLRQVTLTDSASAEQRSLLRIEWHAAKSRIDEASALDDILKRLARMESTTLELLQVLKAMPTPTPSLTALARTSAPTAATPATVALSSRPDSTALTNEKGALPTPPGAPAAELPPPDKRKPIPPSIPANEGFDIGSALPLSVKLIGAVTLLLALSLAAYRWLMTHTPQTDPTEENRPPRHPPYLGGAIRKPHHALAATPSGSGRNPT